MTIWRKRITCWIPNATNTHTGCIKSLLFHSNNGCTNAPQYYVIRTVSVLLFKAVRGALQFPTHVRLFSNGQFVSALKSKEFCVDLLTNAFLLQTSSPRNLELFINTSFWEFKVTLFVIPSKALVTST